MEKLTSIAGLADLLNKKDQTVINWITLDQFNLRSKHMMRVGGVWMIDAEGYAALIEKIKNDTRGFNAKKVAVIK